MELESRFSVPAPPDAAYHFLLDLERVAPCIPGGTLGTPDSEGIYPASVTVKLGPMRLSYDGTIEVADADHEARTATISARARERRGNGTVQSTIGMQITSEGEGSAVAVATRLELTGRAAQMGRGIVEEVAEKMVAEMAACLASRITLDSASTPAPTPAPKPVSLLALLSHVARARLRALFHRGAARP